MARVARPRSTRTALARPHALDGAHVLEAALPTSSVRSCNGIGWGEPLHRRHAAQTGAVSTAPAAHSRPRLASRSPSPAPGTRPAGSQRAAGDTWPSWLELDV